MTHRLAMQSLETAFVPHDERFGSVLGDEPRLERLAETDAHEGPVYAPDEDALYFTTVPRQGRAGPEVAIKRLELNSGEIAVVRESATGANGMTLGLDGKLLVCEQGNEIEPARIAAVDRATGEAETVVDSWEGLPLNSPNDIVAASDGSVWFTDPSYGHLQGFRPEPAIGDYVYRYDATTGRLVVVDDSFDKPNGLAFSPDERVLYGGDSGANQEPGSYDGRRPHRIFAFDVNRARHLTNGRLFAVTTPGFPDGLKVDSDGRVYASAFSGVQIFDPSGDLIGEISLPGAVNFTFGTRRRNVLFVTTDTAVWAATLAATGPASLTSIRPKEEPR
jgi:gluconolactonase